MAIVTVAAVVLLGLSRPHGRAVPIEVTAPLPGLVAVRSLDFRDQPDGSIAVVDVDTGRRAGTVAPGEGSFVRGVMRGLASVRHRVGVGSGIPFRLEASADGRLVLVDPPTATAVDLEGFGPDNAFSFSRFLTSREDPP